MKERIAVWTVLSHFYLDTELNVNDYNFISKSLKNSPYSLAEIVEINKREVFPVLQYNLLSVAGEWAGFNEDWLTNKIKVTLKNRNGFKRMGNSISYLLLKNMLMGHFRKISEILKEDTK